MVFSFLWQFAIFSLSGRFSLDPSTPAPASRIQPQIAASGPRWGLFLSDFLLDPEKCLESFIDYPFASVGGRVTWPVNRLRNATVPLILPPPAGGRGFGVTTGRFSLSHVKRPHVLREEVVGMRARRGR